MADSVLRATGRSLQADCHGGTLMGAQGWPSQQCAVPTHIELLSMPTKGLPVGQGQPGLQGAPARRPGRPGSHSRGPGSSVVTCAKKRVRPGGVPHDPIGRAGPPPPLPPPAASGSAGTIGVSPPFSTAAHHRRPHEPPGNGPRYWLQEYGTGRARLPGLEEMMAAMQSDGSGAAPGGSNGSSSGGLTRPAARPSTSSSGSSSSGGNGGKGKSAAAPPPSGGGSAGEDAPSLGDYLKFGRLLGEKPQQVQQQLALGATRVVVDDDSADYLQASCAGEELSLCSETLTAGGRAHGASGDVDGI